MAYLQLGINSETFWCILWVLAVILAKKKGVGFCSFWFYNPQDGCNLSDFQVASSEDSFAAQTSETDSFGLVGWWCIIRGDAGLEVPLGELADVEIDIIAEQLVASSLHLCIICHLSTF